MSAEPQPATTLAERGPDVRLQVIVENREFAALAPEWNILHEAAAGASVFNSWLWQFHWWQAYGRGRQLRILHASEHGETIGILPMYLDTVSRFGVRVRVLRSIGTGSDTHPDDLTPLLLPGKEHLAAKALARAVLRLDGVDVVCATDMDPDPAAFFVRRMRMEAQVERLAFLAELGQRIKLVSLPGTWDEFLKRLPSSRRARIRSHRRKLESAVRARFLVWEDAESLDQVVGRLVELHRMRWAASGASGSFASTEYVEFHRSVIAATLRRQWLRLYCLEIDGAIAAVTYCYRFRNRVFVMQAGFDPQYARLHPGGVLLGYAIEHAIGEGNEAFDFLRGEHGYKDALATHARETSSVTVMRETLGALAWRASSHWAPALKLRLREAARSMRRAASMRSANGPTEH